MIKNKNIRPVNVGCLTEFPFLDTTFDSVTEWEVLQKLGEKTNEVIHFVNDVIEDKLVEYIDRRFNDILLESMYDSETETLILYVSHGNN